MQSLIEEAEQARIKAMDLPNGAAAAVSAIGAKAKLAGLWRRITNNFRLSYVIGVPARRWRR